MNPNSLSIKCPKTASMRYEQKNQELALDTITCGSGRSVYWRCEEKGHVFENIVRRQTDKEKKGHTLCPTCEKEICKDEYLINKYPNIKKELHPTKNKGIDISSIKCKSRINLWFKCVNGHEYQMIVAHKTAIVNTCIECRKSVINKRKLKKKENCLKITHGHIAEEFHPTKNGELTPENISYGSDIKIHWICKKKKHEWVSSVAKRTRHDRDNQVCPMCRKEKDIYENSFGYNNEDLLDEWDNEKNTGIDPYKISQNSRVSVWWKCKKNNHEWKIATNKRIFDDACPLCEDKKKFLSDYNNLIVELHPTKNDGIDLNRITFGSDKKLWWQCDDGHEWESMVSNRTRGQKCPYCAGKHITSEKSLKIQFPIIYGQLHPTKNKDMDTDDIHIGTDCKFWWKCDKGHVWKATVCARTFKKSGCLYCCGQKTDDSNSFQAKFPKIAKEEWHPTKNDFGPSDVSPSSHKYAWWQCKKKKHEWRTQIYNRCNGSNCPKCANSSYSQVAINWLNKMAIDTNINIQHAENGGEYRISLGGRKCFKADGYCKETNTIFSYHGCLFHADQADNCPLTKRYDPNSIHPFGKITFKEVYEKTLERQKILEGLGYKVIVIWECEDKLGFKRYTDNKKKSISE
jgi:G:T-mismatch repair DNA endonuclease (very short patch repair protein)